MTQAQGLAGPQAAPSFMQWEEALGGLGSCLAASWGVVPSVVTEGACTGGSIFTCHLHGHSLMWGPQSSACVS